MGIQNEIIVEFFDLLKKDENINPELIENLEDCFKDEKISEKTLFDIITKEPQNVNSDK